MLREDLIPHVTKLMVTDNYDGDGFTKGKIYTYERLGKSFQGRGYVTVECIFVLQPHFCVVLSETPANTGQVARQVLKGVDFSV